jgi:hypothetical protein
VSRRGGVQIAKGCPEGVHESKSCPEDCPDLKSVPMWCSRQCPWVSRRVGVQISQDVQRVSMSPNGLERVVQISKGVQDGV